MEIAKVQSNQRKSIQSAPKLEKPWRAGAGAKEAGKIRRKVAEKCCSQGEQEKKAADTWNVENLQAPVKPANIKAAPKKINNRRFQKSKG